MGDVEMSLDEMKRNNIHWTVSVVLSREKFSNKWKSFGSMTIQSTGGSCTFDYCARIHKISGIIDIVISKSSPRPGKAYIQVMGEGGLIKKQSFPSNWANKDLKLYDLYPHNPTNIFIPIANVTREISCTTVWYGFNDELNGSLNVDTCNGKFTDFFSDSRLSDFSVIIGKESIPVHKIILAAQSPVFSRMFNSEMRENLVDQVEIKDIDADIMKMVLKYLYTNNTEELADDMEILSKILAAADKYEMNSLKDHCQTKLARKINIDTALDILLVASTHNGEKLLTIVTEYLVKNKKTIVKTEKFKVMLLERPDLFVEFINKVVDN